MMHLTWHTINYDLKALTNLNIPVSMMADSLLHFLNSDQRSLTIQKRLRIDLITTMSSYDHINVQYMACLQPEINISDALTKFKKNGILLQTL